MDKKAFTLTEVIVAALLITVLATGMFSAFVGAHYIFRRTSHRIAAFNFAREVQDKLRSNYGYQEADYPEMDFGTHEASDIGINISGDLEPLITDFTYKVFTHAEGSQPDGYKKIEVKLGWEEPSF